MSPTALLPNPYTSLAWLPANIATQVEISRYICCAVFGAWMWDALMSVPEDVKLFRKFRTTLSDVVYIFARLTILAFLVSTLVYQVASVDNCQILSRVIGWLTAAALPLNSLLFFFRVRAVFNQSRLIVTCFALMWLAVVAGALSQPFGIDATHIGTTHKCITTVIRSYCSSGIVIATVNDTLSFIAISVQLLMFSLADTWTARFKTFFSGRGMNQMTKLLMQTGQQYYLTTVGVNIITMVVILSPSVPPVFRAVVAIPNAALFNAMACRVYRLVKLGTIRDQTFSSVASSHTAPIQFAPITPKAQSAKQRVVNPDDTLNLASVRTQASRDFLDVAVEIQRGDMGQERFNGSQGNFAVDVKGDNIV